MIRDFEILDLPKIKEIHENNCEFPMPNLDSPIILVKKTIQDESGKIIGSAFVKLTTEVGLILNREIPPITRARILVELHEQLNSILATTDIEDTHIFISPETDTHHADFLIRNLGFRKDTSLVLYREIKHEQESTEAII